MTSQPINEELKFAIFSPSSVQSFADSIGLDSLSKEVLKSLSEDATYRVREIVSKSCEFMRCSRRRRLKSCDVDRALKWSKVKPLHGVNNSLNFSVVDEGGGLYYSEDPVIDLKELAFVNTTTIQRAPITLSSKWLPVQNKSLQLSKDEKYEKTDVTSKCIIGCTFSFSMN